MRIALITPGFSANANDWAIPALLNLARTLAQKHDVHIFSQRYPTRGIYHFDGLTHYALGGGQKFGASSIKIWLQTRRAIIRQHKKTPFDILHAFWADEAGFAAVLAGSGIKRPVVVSIGGGELTRLPQIKYGAQRFLSRRLTTRYALRRAAAVTAGSNYQLDICRKYQIPDYKLRLAPLGVDVDRFQPVANIAETLEYQRPKKQKTISNDSTLPLRGSRPSREGGQVSNPSALLTTSLQSPNLPTTTPTLIQAASLVPVKNQQLLLEILYQVKKEIPAIKLILAGSGPLQNELVNLANQLGLSHNITWRGQVPYPEMNRLYQESHLYLQTSHHESQGMAVLEAMACGVPALGTPVGVVKEKAGLPAQTAKESLATQVIEILTDQTRYLALRKQARQIIEKQFSREVTAANFLQIYARFI